VRAARNIVSAIFIVSIHSEVDATPLSTPLSGSATTATPANHCCPICHVSFCGNDYHINLTQLCSATNVRFEHMNREYFWSQFQHDLLFQPMVPHLLI